MIWTPDRRQNGIACYEAGCALNSRAAEYHDKARAIFERYGIKAKLRRMDGAAIDQLIE